MSKKENMKKIIYEDCERIAEDIALEKCSGKSFLIAGASGFLGKWIVDLLMYLNARNLCEEKCKVIALCRNLEKARKVFSGYQKNENFKILEQSVERPVGLMEKVDYIIHAASAATTTSFTVNPVGILAANVIGTYHLLEFARINGVKGFLFLSSGAVYGDTPDYVDELREDDFYRLDFNQIGNCYSEAKRAGELLCRAYWEQYQVPAKSIRISHTYGPGIDIEDGRVFSDFVKNIIHNEDLLIKGSGLDSRPFCYVSDAVSAFFKILFDGEPGETYNMANSEQTVTISELAELLTQHAFKERDLEVRYLQAKSEERNVHKIIVNTDKLNRLGWKPRISIVEGFRRTVTSLEEMER